ncbi:MAG: hypothetical protein LQ340_001583 [Diploschistes diacapsis]|nr:MAG: hypothetical protein LQ340_001583 [Diploschistes diacapsis]
MLEAMGAPRGAEKNILFTNIDPITGDIAQAKPDYYYGARLEQIHPHVRNELSKHIIPSNHTRLPAVPNFFLEAKGPDGSLAVAKRQACHDGAISARAMQSLRSYRQDEPIYDNNAYTISSIYHGGQLKMYGHSVAQPKGPGTRPEYYMHQLRSFAMTDFTDTFLDGATAFKNAVDLTEEYRNAAITLGNKTTGQQSKMKVITKTRRKRIRTKMRKRPNHRTRCLASTLGQTKSSAHQPRMRMKVKPPWKKIHGGFHRRSALHQSRTGLIDGNARLKIY